MSKIRKKHHWNYSNLHDHLTFRCYLDRECQICGRKEHRTYLGGDMWKWTVVKTSSKKEEADEKQ